MEKTISIGIAKYFFNKGIELDLDNVVCKESKELKIYLYKGDLILTADYSVNIVELHYVEVLG